MSATHGLFRIEVPAGTISVTPDSPSGMAAGLEGLAPTLMKRLDPQRDDGTMEREIGGTKWLLVFTPIRTASGVSAIIGFVTNTASLRPAVLRSFRRAPVLPAVLAGGALTNDKLSVEMKTAGGTAVLESGVPFDATFGIIEPIRSGAFSGGSIRISVPAGYAPRLIIGGVPESDVLPSALGIGCSILLLFVGIQLLRRESALFRLRTDFVASVSHELRTPLTQIRMFAETLLLDRVRNSDDRRRSLEIIDRESIRLAHLVENVLCFSRGERGGIRLEPEEIELGAVANSAIEAFIPLARAKGVRIAFTTVPGAVALCDPDAIRQVLLNLLDNAVKYGPDSQEVKVIVEASPPQIIVEDQGPGIPPADQQRIWRRFVRLERDQKRHHGGSGIGLAVVRELIEIQGGRVRVEMRGSGGSRFIVELQPLNARQRSVSHSLAAGLS